MMITERLGWDPGEKRFTVGEFGIHCGTCVEIWFLGRWREVSFELSHSRRGTGWYFVLDRRALSADDWLGAKVRADI